MTLLRQYERWECGQDGYPLQWHSASVPCAGGGSFYGELPEQYTWTAEETDGWRPAIKDLIREQDGHRCLRCGHPYPPGIAETHPRGEWTPCDESCTHGQPFRQVNADGFIPFSVGAGHNVVVHGTAGEYAAAALTARIEAHWRILTVHHLDEDKANCRWWNLVSLCQRCHLRMQRTVIMGRVYNYEHSEWFKPYAAGFYAWKYLGEDLSREDALGRLEELLRLEHRFTQETLL